MTVISSLQNPRVKNAVRLRDRRHREKQGRILIDGARELCRAIAAGVKMLEVYVCQPLCAAADARRVLTMLPGCGAEILDVTEEVFAKLAFGQRGEGVLGVAEMPLATLDHLEARLFLGSRATADEAQGPAASAGGTRKEVRSTEYEVQRAVPPSALRPPPSESPLLAVVEGVEKPGNLGAVMRSADGAGVSAVIVADARTDLYNPNAIRASLGTIFTVPVCAATAPQTRAWLAGRHLEIVAARPHASMLYTKVDYRRPTAIVLGSEALGLSAAWSGDGITAVRLPMLGTADSLNISTAAAVLFYEARRQRGAKA